MRYVAARWPRSTHEQLAARLAACFAPDAACRAYLIKTATRALKAKAVVAREQHHKRVAAMTPAEVRAEVTKKLYDTMLSDGEVVYASVPVVSPAPAGYRPPPRRRSKGKRAAPARPAAS
jgi:hypothetical protein